MQILLTMWNRTFMSKTFPSSTKFLPLKLHYTRLLQQTMTHSMFLPSLTIFHQLISSLLVLRHIINSIVVQVSWMMMKLWWISSNSLIWLLGIPSKFQLIITSPICLLLATLHAQRKSWIWLDLTLNLLWPHSTTIQSSLISGMLRLMNLNMILTPMCVAHVLELKKM